MTFITTTVADGVPVLLGSQSATPVAGDEGVDLFKRNEGLAAVRRTQPLASLFEFDVLLHSTWR